MDFVSKKYSNINIVDIKKKVLDLKTVRKIINNFSKHNFAIDCSEIECFSDKNVIETLFKENINLVCNNPHLITQAGLLGQRNFPKFFVSKEDCINNKRMLIRRRFRVV